MKTIINRKFTAKETTVLQMLIEYAYAKEVDDSLLTYWNPEQIENITFWKDSYFAEDICHDFYKWVNSSYANSPKYNSERDSFNPFLIKEGLLELIDQLDDFVKDYGLEEIKYKEVA